jgi:hypothetical protein
MHAWAQSFKRPDLSERDRVRGVLMTYQRQAFALRIMSDRPHTV